MSQLKRCPCPDHDGPNPLPRDKFSPDRKPDGLTSWCKACIARARRHRRAADPAKDNAAARQRRAANPEKAREYERRWRAANLEKARETQRRWRIANREYLRARRRRYSDALRQEVFGHYGSECACCGATENLTIDHVNGGGGEHRAALFGTGKVAGVRFWLWLIKNGFPPGFQSLCWPCNSSKANRDRCQLGHRSQSETCPIMDQPAAG